MSFVNQGTDVCLLDDQFIGDGIGYRNIAFERTDPLGLVTIDRPERSNAVDYETGQEFVDALEHIDADDDLAVDIVTETGDVFCGGADLKEIADGVDATVGPSGRRGGARRGQPLDG